MSALVRPPESVTTFVSARQNSPDALKRFLAIRMVPAPVSASPSRPTAGISCRRHVECSGRDVRHTKRVARRRFIPSTPWDLGIRLVLPHRLRLPLPFVTEIAMISPEELSRLERGELALPPGGCLRKRTRCRVREPREHRPTTCGGQAASLTSSAGSSVSNGSPAPSICKRTRSRRWPPTPRLPRSSMTVPVTSPSPKTNFTLDPTVRRRLLGFVPLLLASRLDTTLLYHRGAAPTTPAKCATTAASKCVANARHAARHA